MSTEGRLAALEVQLSELRSRVKVLEDEKRKREGAGSPTSLHRTTPAVHGARSPRPVHVRCAMNARQRKKRSRPWIYTNRGRWKQVPPARFVKLLGRGTYIADMVARLQRDGLLIIRTV